MIELSEEWLAEAARRAAEEEDAWIAARPRWLTLEDERSPLIGRPTSVDDADKRWAARFPALAKHRARSDIQRWREVGARQDAPVFPIFTKGRRSAA